MTLTGCDWSLSTSLTNREQKNNVFCLSFGKKCTYTEMKEVMEEPKNNQEMKTPCTLRGLVTELGIPGKSLVVTSGPQPSGDLDREGSTTGCDKMVNKLHKSLQSLLITSFFLLPACSPSIFHSSTKPAPYTWQLYIHSTSSHLSNQPTWRKLRKRQKLNQHKHHEVL